MNPGPPRPTLRREEPADRPFVARVYAATRDEELAQVDWPPAERDRFVAQQFEAQRAYYLEHYPDAEFSIVELGEEPVGRLYVERRPTEIRLMDISILPAARGRGAGGALVADLVEESRRSGKPLTIHVERFNRALSLYQRLGFAVKEDRGVYLFLEWDPAREGRG